MVKHYLKRSAMLLGAAAIAATASAGDFVDVTRNYITDPTYIPGWQGVIGASNNGVGEVWSGAFRLYQIVDVPAGTYVLTVDAFYRCGNNDYSKANQSGKADLNTATIFINDKHATVKALFEGRESAPNSTWEAAEAFAKGEYTNNVTYEHQGGEMIIGIQNTGCYDDEWCCFDNFRLMSGSTDYTDKIVNADFSHDLDAKRAWDNWSSENKEKTPDIQKDGACGGAYRKCGGSPYNTGQQVELPAGKYRFGMLCMHRYGSTMDAAGKLYNHKWPCGETEPYGTMGRSPKDWFEANDYDQVGDERYAHAYIYMSQNANKPKSVAWSESEAEGDLIEATDARTRVKDCWEICNGDVDNMPDNNPKFGWTEGYEANVKYETKNKNIYVHDSGNEREIAAAFVAEPEKWFQYVEFELTEPTKVWLGLGKDSNTGDGYWHAWADKKLLVWDENAQSGVATIVADEENAPVEYYNLQGVRVANPANGLYIVKQGKKVSKTFIR